MVGTPSAQSVARSPMGVTLSAQSVARSPMVRVTVAQSVARSPMGERQPCCAECGRSPMVG